MHRQRGKSRLGINLAAWLHTPPNLRSGHRKSHAACKSRAACRLVIGILPIDRFPLTKCRKDDYKFSHRPDTNKDYEATLVEAVTHLVLTLESPEKVVVVGGTRGGFILEIEIQSVTPLKVIHRLEKVGNLPVEIISSPGSSEPSSAQPVFLCCGPSVALLDNYDTANGNGFRSRTRIVPVDGGSPNLATIVVTSVAQIPTPTANPRSLLMVTGSRLLVTRLEGLPVVIPRLIPLKGMPTRVLYSHVLECLVVAVNVNNRPTLMFLHPDSGQNLSWPTDRNREDQEFISGLGHEGDWIHCLDEWLFTKEGKRFSFILVTTHSGRLLIISTEKIDGQVRFWTRHKKASSGPPIYSVSAVADNIFYCVGSTIHWEVLDVTERRIREHAKIDLVSPATSLRILSGRLYALTQAHSLEIVNLDLLKSQDSYTTGHRLIEKRMRPTTHMTDIGSASNSSGAWPITLISDRECGIVGVWIPRGGEDGDIEVVLEAELPASIRRFQKGHTRPAWWRSKLGQPQYGRIPSTAEDAEVLGVCLDGSIHNFTLLTMEAWRFLKLIQNVADSHYRVRLQVSSDQVEEISEPSPVPKLQLHVNGDILYWCFQSRNLETLFRNQKESQLFMRYLDELDGGEWTQGFDQSECDCATSICHPEVTAEPLLSTSNSQSRKSPSRDPNDRTHGAQCGLVGRYLGLGYQILDYYMSPAL